MRFLMICMQYPTQPGQSYMTTELAEALQAAGHQVEVLLLDWAARPGGHTGIFTSEGNIRVVRCTPRAVAGLGTFVRNASKFVLSGFHAARVARDHFDLKDFDAAIAWMPATAIAPALGLLRRSGIGRRLLFIWDFFPDHHREIGLIPTGIVYRTARACEQKLLAQFTAIVCTLPGNAAYLRSNYSVRPDQRVLVTPIWSDTSPLPPTDRDTVRSRHGLPADGPIAVFGGQLTQGRGFEQMLGAADTAASAASPLHFLFVGDGRLAPSVRARAKSQSNVHYLPPLSRQAYLELLGACDVGMVATVPGVTSYSIPTKTIDYLRAGLPVVAAVEEGNDLASILERYGVGSAVPFNDSVAFLDAVERLAADRRSRPRDWDAARRCLDEVFDVRHAVSAVLEAVRA
ncbi:MAG: glycosyltransferase family 4 protein [Sphingomonadales bacterium]